MTPSMRSRRSRDAAGLAEATQALDRATSRAQRRGAARDLDQTLWDLTRVVELGDGLVEDAALAPARTVLERAGERRRIAPGVTVVALLGATGSGKSSLFNALTGATIARTAVTRPTTTKPLAALPADLKSLPVVRVLRYGLLVLVAAELVPALLRRWLPRCAPGS